VRNHSYENVFRLQANFRANQTRFRTKTRFETEAHVNSEIAYFQRVKLVLFYLLGL